MPMSFETISWGKPSFVDLSGRVGLPSFESEGQAWNGSAISNTPANDTTTCYRPACATITGELTAADDLVQCEWLANEDATHESCGEWGETVDRRKLRDR